MSKFQIILSVEKMRLYMFVWAFSPKQAREHARNLATLHQANIINVEEI
jgi:hypothetical protein